jgi:hypothetical protein
MRHAAVKTKEWKVFIETTHERPDDSGEVRVGDPIVLSATGGVPIVARLEEVHDESGVLFVKFYDQS